MSVNHSLVRLVDCELSQCDGECRTLRLELIAKKPIYCRAFLPLRNGDYFAVSPSGLFFLERQIYTRVRDVF